MPARTIPFRAAVHLQCLASTGSGRAPVDCTRPPPPWAAAAAPAQQRRLFNGTRSLRDDIDDKTHYETLNVKTNASAAEIKKSFYTLSKTHHPDHNQSDPNASRRFMRISEAYTTLSHTSSRAKYDRDVLRLHAQHPSHHGRTASHGGSYHSSSSPAGARPASGLSRRRGTFRGPPPSFFRSGGWGAHGAKRAAAHDESTGGGAGGAEEEQRRRTKARDEDASSSSTAGGMGPGQEPFGRGAREGEVPHFGRDAKEAHTRTHTRVDEARRARRQESGFAFSGARMSDASEFGRFFAVLVVLGVGMGIPFVLSKAWGSNSGREKKAKKKD